MENEGDGDFNFDQFKNFMYAQSNYNSFFPNTNNSNSNKPKENISFYDDISTVYKISSISIYETKEGEIKKALHLK